METESKFDSVDFELATEEYESQVARCADGDLPFEIDNFHIAHAAILTKHIIRRTQHSVDILSGSLPELFFKKIGLNLKDALERKIPVRIIFMNKQTACSELVNLAKRYSNLSVYEINDELRSQVKTAVCHFCVSDNKRFRIEEIHPDKDFETDPSIKAKASFNQPEAAKLLHESFNQLLDLSSPVKFESASGTLAAVV